MGLVRPGRNKKGFGHIRFREWGLGFLYGVYHGCTCTTHKAVRACKLYNGGLGYVSRGFGMRASAFFSDFM